MKLEDPDTNRSFQMHANARTRKTAIIIIINRRGVQVLKMICSF